jgi:hypothetical protein
VLPASVDFTEAAQIRAQVASVAFEEHVDLHRGFYDSPDRSNITSGRAWGVEAGSSATPPFGVTFSDEMILTDRIGYLAHDIAIFGCPGCTLEI